jgi:hypothetical protein
VKWHGDGHPAVGHAQALKLGHLINGWNGLANRAECLPCKAWRTLLVQLVVTNCTVSVVLKKHGGSHLYKRCNTCQHS